MRLFFGGGEREGSIGVGSVERVKGRRIVCTRVWNIDNTVASGPIQAPLIPSGLF